jgi:hypothetical protein
LESSKSKEVQGVADSLGVTLHALRASTNSDIEQAFVKLKELGAPAS